MAILIELCAVAWYIHQTSIVEKWIYRTPKPQNIALILTRIRLAYTDANKLETFFAIFRCMNASSDLVPSAVPSAVPSDAIL
jgi:hypothetical protein